MGNPDAARRFYQWSRFRKAVGVHLHWRNCAVSYIPTCFMASSRADVASAVHLHKSALASISAAVNRTHGRQRLKACHRYPNGRRMLISTKHYVHLGTSARARTAGRQPVHETLFELQLILFAPSAFHSSNFNLLRPISSSNRVFVNSMLPVKRKHSSFCLGHCH